MNKYSWLFEVLDSELVEALMSGETKDLAIELVELNFQNENEENLLKCALCPNMCEFACPVLKADGRETISPARKSKLGYFYSIEKLEAEELEKNPYYCLSCDACKQNCPMDLSVCDMLVPIREEINEENATPKGVEEVGEKLAENEIIYEEIESSENDGLKEGEGETLYFRSCVARKEAPELVDSTLDVLTSLGENIQTLGEEICCGAPAKSLGFKDSFSEIAERNKKKLNESGAEKIVFSCPTCTYTLREVYPDEGYEIEPKVLHISEYLAENLDQSMDLELNEPLNVTYHDPCTLARKLEVTEEPRKVLNTIENLNLTEPYLSKDDTNCCGRGGALKFVNEEVSEDIAKDRVRHLSDYEDTIITSCPSCRFSLKNATGEEEVLNLSEIVLEALE